MIRFFRAPAAIYTAVRAGLDLAFGHPYEHTAEDGTVVRTETCLAPVEQLQQDGQGRVVVSLLPLDYKRPEVVPLLAEMLANGQIEEITEAEFFAASSVPEELGATRSE